MQNSIADGIKACFGESVTIKDSGSVSGGDTYLSAVVGTVAYYA